uniref:Uncharacterized protein n=1 Tax=Bactrocera dorsalis TaxID=27457 RepID=A0A034VBM0_BACDO
MKKDEIYGQYEPSPKRILKDLDRKCKLNSCNSCTRGNLKTGTVNQTNNINAITPEDTLLRQRKLCFKRQNEISNRSQEIDISQGSLLFYGTENFTLRTSGPNKINDNTDFVTNNFSEKCFDCVPEQYHTASSPQQTQYLVTNCEYYKTDGINSKSTDLWLDATDKNCYGDWPLSHKKKSIDNSKKEQLYGCSNANSTIYVTQVPSTSLIPKSYKITSTDTSIDLLKYKLSGEQTKKRIGGTFIKN